jgi:ribonuclease BN (tRNA processing enzyme)
MRVTLLGTGQLHPADRVQCGTLIEDVPLLVDCGAGVYQRLHESAVDVEELEHVLLTHLHQDHVNDLVPIVGAKRHADSRPLPDGEGRRDGESEQSPLTVHGPPGTERFVELTARAHVKFVEAEDSPVEFPLREGGIDLSVEEITPGSAVAIEGLPVETLATKHGDEGRPSLAYKFDGEVVVSGDTAAIDAMAAFVDDARVLIHECTFLHGEDNSGHTTPRDLARVLEGSDVEELYLNHLPAHTPRERRATIETIRARFDGNVTVARDMERVSTR